MSFLALYFLMLKLIPLLSVLKCMPWFWSNKGWNKSKLITKARNSLYGIVEDEVLRTLGALSFVGMTILYETYETTNHISNIVPSWCQHMIF